MSKFNNKTVVITGGNSGMGLSTAQHFLSEGAEVYITGRSADKLKQAAGHLGNDPKLKTVLSDISDIKTLDALVTAIADSGKKVDVLFLNAGVALFAPIEQTTEDVYDAMFNTNVKGLFFTLQKLIPHLADGASVVLNSSVVSNGAMANASVYAATKAAVTALGRVAANELAAKNIRVNVVSPGPIDTPIFDKAGFPEEAKAQFKTTIQAAIPVGRMGRAEEVARAVAYLSSPEAAFITGADLLVDGGIGLRR